MKPALICLLALICTALCAPRSAAQSKIVFLHVVGGVGPASADYITRGIESAESQNANAVVLELDTPGGLDSSMRAIVQQEMNAKIPVVVYVSPRGARAGSAGCFIALAADVASMAPATNIGAAHPVYSSGGDVSEKVVNDSAAYARSIAAVHGRNAYWAEQAVRQSVSATAQEALSDGVIDFIANDRDDLLRQLNGRKVHLATGDVTLVTAGAQIVDLHMDLRESLFEALTNPTVVYMLFLLGVLAIFVEIFAPHGFVTGTIGAIALLLALVGVLILPVQISGAALLLVGIILLALELKITSHGVLTLIGFVTFILGSIFVLPRIPGYSISPYAILAVAMAWLIAFSFVVRLVMRAKRSPVLTGIQRVVGKTGIAKSDFTPRGVALVGGEEWDALADVLPIQRGDQISVVSVDGLTIHVRKVS